MADGKRLFGKPAIASNHVQPPTTRGFPDAQETNRRQPMKSRRTALRQLAVALALAGIGSIASAQAFPQKPITLIVPNPPGGLVDGSARLLAEPLSRMLGQSVVVDNRGGGAATSPMAMWRVRRPTGTRCSSRTRLTTWATRPCSPKLPWAQKDLAPVALITAATNVIAVHPSVPADNLKEFIGYLKKQPRQA